MSASPKRSSAASAGSVSPDCHLTMAARADVLREGIGGAEWGDALCSGSIRGRLLQRLYHCNVTGPELKR